MMKELAVVHALLIPQSGESKPHEKKLIVPQANPQRLYAAGQKYPILQKKIVIKLQQAKKKC